jgi:signal recognition particle GTPase
MADGKTGELWKQHFPNWQGDREANLTCRAICLVILGIASHELKTRGRYDEERLDRILRLCGITKTEFNEVAAKYSGLNNLLRKFQATASRKKQPVKRENAELNEAASTA